MLCREIDLRWNLFLSVERILRNASSKKKDCDDEDNWSNSSFNLDSIESIRDLNTKNSVNVRYSFVETLNTLHASRNAVLSTTHFDEYSNNSTNVARVTRNLILIENNQICDLIFVMMIIWMICKNSFVKISRANLWSTSQNWFNSNVWMMIVFFSWIMKSSWNVHAQKKENYA